MSIKVRFAARFFEMKGMKNNMIKTNKPSSTFSINRIFALLLAVLLLCGMVPATATIARADDTYTVILMDDAAQISSEDAAPNAAYALTGKAPAKANYNFTGWSTNANGTGTVYTDAIPADTYAVGDSVTLYAQYALKSTSNSFYSILRLDENASVPSATINFTIAAGTGEAAVPGSTLAVIAPTAANGVTGTPTISSVTYAPGDPTVTSVEGVTLAAGQKAVKKDVFVNFEGVTFAQPGIFRYVITEPSSGYGLDYDTVRKDTANGVRYQRVLDVYVYRTNNGYEIGDYVFHEVAGSVANGASNAADKSVGFVHDYNTTSLTLKCLVEGNQASTDKYFAYTITMQNPYNTTFTPSVDWTDGAGALTPADNPATTYPIADITAANNAGWTSNPDGSLTKTIYPKHDQKVALDAIPIGTNYTITVTPEDYTDRWTVEGYVPSGEPGGSTYQLVASGTTTTTGNRVLNSHEDDIFILTRAGVVPTGLEISIIPGMLIVAVSVAAALIIFSKKKATYTA